MRRNKNQPALRLVIDNSRGYKSGRISERDTPDISSSSNTRSAGTPLLRHLWTACGEMPRDLATDASPPDARIARSIAFDSMVAVTKPQVDSRVNLRSVVYLNRGFHARAMKSRDGMSPLGRTIIEALRRLDLTQAWLAEELHVSENAVSKWIRTGQISRANGVKLAEALALSLEDVMRPNGHASGSAFDARWQALPPDTKAKIFELIDSLGLDTQRPAPARRKTKQRKVG